MASIINATTTNGVAISADNSGILQLATNSGTTAVTIDASQNVNFLGKRITGDLNNATPSLRLSFQSSVLNDNSSINLIPNGTGTSTSFTAFNNSNPDNASLLAFSAVASTDIRIASGATGTGTYLPITFYTNNAERVRIDNSGNVLVGTTASLYSIPQGVAMSGSLIGAIVVGHASGTTTGNGYINFNYNASLIGSITQSGTTAVLYNTTSDYRLKTDVTTIQNALVTIEALNPVSFTWVDGRPDDGFIAHELQAVISNCVTGEKDAINEDGTPKYQQMDNSGVIPFLVKAIQELKAIIDTQQIQITALNAKVGI